MVMTTLSHCFYIPSAPLNCPYLIINIHHSTYHYHLYLTSLFSGLMAEIEKLSSIRIVQTRNPRPLLLGLSLFAVFLALFVSAAAPDLEKALFWYQSRYLWVVVRCVICHLLCNPLSSNTTINSLYQHLPLSTNCIKTPH